MAEYQPASPREGSAGAGDDVVGGLHVFPCVPFSVELWQQAAGSQGSPIAQGIVFAVLGTVALPETNLCSSQCFPLLLPYGPLAPHHIFIPSWVLGHLLLLAAWLPACFQSHNCPYQPKEATSGESNLMAQNLGWSVLARLKVLEGPRDPVQHILLKLQLTRPKESGQDTAGKWKVEVSMRVLENCHENSEII